MSTLHFMAILTDSFCVPAPGKLAVFKKKQIWQTFIPFLALDSGTVAAMATLKNTDNSENKTMLKFILQFRCKTKQPPRAPTHASALVLLKMTAWTLKILEWITRMPTEQKIVLSCTGELTHFVRVRAHKVSVTHRHKNLWDHHCAVDRMERKSK